MSRVGQDTSARPALPPRQVVLLPLEDLPEVTADSDLAGLLAASLRAVGGLHDGDILVVSEADGVVVTVLFHLPEGWPDGQRRPSGRRMSKLARRRLTADLRRAGGH